MWWVIEDFEDFEDFKDLRMIFGSNIASGKNVVGLGDVIFADTYQVGDSEEANDSNHVQTMAGIEGIIYEDTYIKEVFSTLEKRIREKLPQRKKARTDAINSNWMRWHKSVIIFLACYKRDGKK